MVRTIEKPSIFISIILTLAIPLAIMLIGMLLDSGFRVAIPTPYKGWEMDSGEGGSVSLNRGYEWYVDQNELQLGRRYNDGPACAVMAAKWADSAFSKSLRDARDAYTNNDLGVVKRWSFDDIYNFLADNGIDCRFDSSIALPKMKGHLDSGNILIAYISTYSISYNRNSEQRTGKYYLSFNGKRIDLALTRKFILIKGYRSIGGETYFEVYDPNGQPQYRDGTKKGKDRYYLASEVINGVEIIGQQFLVVSAMDL